MVKIRQWTRPKPFEAQVSEKDFALDEEEIPDELQQGGKDHKLRSSFTLRCFSEVLCESVYLTVDPYMRYVDMMTKIDDLVFFFSVHGDAIGDKKVMFGQGVLKSFFEDEREKAKLMMIFLE